MHLKGITCAVALLTAAPASAQTAWWQPPAGHTAVQVTWACAAFGDRDRSLVYMTDLFEVTLMWDVDPEPERADYDRRNAAYLFSRKTSDAFASELWASGVRGSTDASCSAISRQQYMKWFEAWSDAKLVRVAFRGPDKAIAPDLINDLGARAKYAALWTKGDIAPAPPTPKPTPIPATKPASTPPLIAKQDTSLRDAGKAWEEQVKQSLAAEAQRKVETAAKAAQADAKQKAQIEAFFAQRRRQGSAQ